MDPRERSAGPAIPDRPAWLSAHEPRVAFIGIGAQKCASTWLHDLLSQHPQVRMPDGPKEVDFFSSHYDFGYQWYEQRFGGERSLLAGEISPSYCHTPGVPARVAAYNPAMRVILIVREPVARAISNHKHEVRIGHLNGDDLSFEAGLANNPAYIEQGLYAKHLREWLAVFPPAQILVLRFDDVRATPAAVMDRVCDFLGIDRLPEDVDPERASNESYLVRHGALESGKNALRTAVRRLGFGAVWQWLGNTGLRDSYRRANRVAPEAAIGEPRPETLERLKAVFGPDMEELERLTGLPLGDWR